MHNVYPFKSKNSLEKKDTIASLVQEIIEGPMRNIFALCVVDGGITLVERADNLISPLRKSLEFELGNFLLTKNINGTKAAQLIRSAENYIKGYPVRRIEGDVKAIAYRDSNELAWILIDRPASPITLEDLPEFKVFLSQTDEESQHCLKMWIGALLDDRSSRRQYLHLVGEGAEGKSTLITALDKALSGNSVTLTARQIQGAFFGSELEGKRLYCFTDENNPAFFSTGGFKSLTGDSQLDINEKYKACRKIKLTGKTIICTNSEIILEGNTADRSRCISLKLKNVEKPLDWYVGFLSKSSEMVLYCKAYYDAELAQNPGIRKELPNVKANVQAAVDRKNEGYEEIISDCLKFDDSARVKRSSIHRIFYNAMRSESQSIIRGQVKKLLEAKGCHLITIDGHKYYRGVQVVGDYT